MLDPFGGSGTTLAVAKKLGRKWIGFELSADYARKIEARLAEIEVGQPLDGAADPLRSVPATPIVEVNGKSTPGNGVARRARASKRRSVPAKKSAPLFIERGAAYCIAARTLGITVAVCGC